MNWWRMGAFALLIAGSTASLETLKAGTGPADGEPSMGADTATSAETANSISIEETWARVAPEMGKNLPMKVDDQTTWLTVKNDGPVLVSTFRKNLPKAEIVAAKSEMERDAIENTCRGTQRGKELLDAGGIMRQVFYDRDGALAVTINVDSKACRQNESPGTQEP